MTENRPRSLLDPSPQFSIVESQRVGAPSVPAVMTVLPSGCQLPLKLGLCLLHEKQRPNSVTEGQEGISPRNCVAFQRPPAHDTYQELEACAGPNCPATASTSSSMRSPITSFRPMQLTSSATAGETIFDEAAADRVQIKFLREAREPVSCARTDCAPQLAGLLQLPR